MLIPWIFTDTPSKCTNDITGPRCRACAIITPTITLQMVEDGVLEKLLGPVTWSALCGDTSRLGLGLRLPKLVARILHPRPRKLMGVNFSGHYNLKRLMLWEGFPGHPQRKDYLEPPR